MQIDTCCYASCWLSVTLWGMHLCIYFTDLCQISFDCWLPMPKCLLPDEPLWPLSILHYKWWPVTMTKIILEIQMTRSKFLLNHEGFVDNFIIKFIIRNAGVLTVNSRENGICKRHSNSGWYNLHLLCTNNIGKVGIHFSPVAMDK